MFRRIPLTVARRYSNKLAGVQESMAKVRILSPIPSPKEQILVSNRAGDRLGSIYKDSNEILRVSVESGGCHGFQYNLQLVSEDSLKARDEDDPVDVVMELENKGKVVIDESALNILKGATLTYTTELIGSTFKIMGGAMKSACGCGSSFDVEV